MTEEGWGMVPRKDRPEPEDLEGYTESRYPPEADYTAYRRERALWLADYRRDEEEKREEGGDSQPLFGHEDPVAREGARNGYNPADFDLMAVRDTIESRPLH